MSSLPHGQALRGFGEGRSAPPRWLGRAGTLLRTCLHTWRERYQQRCELLEVMDDDYRTAADIGMTKHEARQWAERPFWRP